MKTISEKLTDEEKMLEKYKNDRASKQLKTNMETIKKWSKHGIALKREKEKKLENSTEIKNCLDSLFFSWEIKFTSMCSKHHQG